MIVDCISITLDVSIVKVQVVYKPLIPEEKEESSGIPTIEPISTMALPTSCLVHHPRRKTSSV